MNYQNCQNLMPLTSSDTKQKFYKFCPKRTGFNVNAEYTRPQLNFLALHPCELLRNNKIENSHNLSLQPTPTKRNLKSKLTFKMAPIFQTSEKVLDHFILVILAECDRHGILAPEIQILHVLKKKLKKLKFY